MAPYAQSLSRAWRGAIYCGLSGIPLSFIFVLAGAIWGDYGGPTGLFLGFAIYLLFCLGITFASAFLFGFPVYLVLSKLGYVRLWSMASSGSVGGLLVFFAWIGMTLTIEQILDSWLLMLGFAFLGTICATIFWYGAERSRPAASTTT